MADRHALVWNVSEGRFENLQAGDTAKVDGPVHITGAVTADSTVDGRDLAADGAKVDFLTVTGAIDLDTTKTTVDYITVTGAVDLDVIDARITALAQAMVLKGIAWDASAAAFPTSTVMGEAWICSVAGTVDTQAYEIGDMVIAKKDGASTLSRLDWHHIRYNDHVDSVAGKTGAVTLVEADITDLQAYLLSTSIDTLSKLNAIVGESLMTTEQIDTLSELNTIVGDTDVLAADGSVAADYLDFTPGAAPAHTEGRLFFDNVRDTLSYYINDPNLTMNIGEENWVHVRNDTGAQIDDGTPVYISGASGGIPQITKIIADGEHCIGVTTGDIANGAVGHVTTHGTVNGLDLSSFSIGDTLWVSTSVAGELQNTEPQWPAKAIKVGIVLNNSATVGSLLVELDNHANPDVLNKSYNFSARTASSGTYYLAGYYDGPATDANLTQASPTVTHGTANAPYAAHAYMVFGAGSTDGVNITITVSGTSITDAGVRTPADSEVLYTGPVAGLTLNDMLETTKKWLGQITYTLTSDGTVFTCDFNYGFAKYEDFHNFDFTLRAFEFVGLADATDNGFNIQIYHHKNTGWTYSAAAFVPGNTALHDMNVEHSTEQDVAAGEHFAWKESNVSTFVDGTALEGLIIKVTTSVNNSIAYLNGHLTVTVDG